MMRSNLAKGKGCSFARETVIARLCRDVTVRTDRGLNDRFGISYNTWKKLMAGQAVRTSLLARLERRLGLETEG